MWEARMMAIVPPWLSNTDTSHFLDIFDLQVSCARVKNIKSLRVKIYWLVVNASVTQQPINKK